MANEKRICLVMANPKEILPMPEPNYADILASVEKHFPAHVLENLESERKRKTRRASATQTEGIANNEATCNTVTPADDASVPEAVRPTGAAHGAVISADKSS